MYTRPGELPDERLAGALHTGWGMSVASVGYVPVGFGSHHWTAIDSGGTRWFVTVDDLRAKLHSAADSTDEAFTRLRAALATARAARDGGAAFVIAPVPNVRGEVLERIDDRFTVAVYPFVEGRSHASGEYTARDDRVAVLQLVIALHCSPAAVASCALADEFAIPRRDGLLDALANLGSPWRLGPYGERTRELLGRHARGVVRLLAHHDVLVAEAGRVPERMVLTHGEPHLANTMLTGEGWVLIDWDTACVAPPERDLWMLDPGDGSIAHEYCEVRGVDVLPSMLDLYRLRWDLFEIAGYVTGFREPHDETTDTATAFVNLVEYLAPATRWPDIAG